MKASDPAPWFVGGWTFLVLGFVILTLAQGRFAWMNAGLAMLGLQSLCFWRAGRAEERWYANLQRQREDDLVKAEKLKRRLAKVDRVEECFDLDRYKGEGV